MNLEKEFYSIKEVCELFGVTRATVYDWMNTRGLAWVRIGVGGRRRITKEALQAFIKAGRDADASEGYNRSDIRKPMPAVAFNS